MEVESTPRERRGPPTTSKRRRLWSAGLGALFLCGVFLGEVLVRLFDLAPEQHPTLTGNVLGGSTDPEFVFENRPGAELVALFRNHAGGSPRRVVHTINAQGWRGREADTERTPGRGRIACVGDSLMFGMYVEEQETFPRMLERALAAAAPELDVEALNFSVIGFGDPEKAHLIEAVLPAYRPDLVLMQVHGGDGGHKLMSRLQAGNRVTRWLRPDRGGWFGALREHSLVVDVVADSLFARAFDANWVQAHRKAVLLPGSAWDTMCASIANGREHAQAIGSEFLLVLFPVLYRAENGLITAELGRSLAGFAAEHGIAFLDLHAAFEGHVVETLRVHPTDNHYSGKAHRIAADAVAESLLGGGPVLCRDPSAGGRR